VETFFAKFGERIPKALLDQARRLQHLRERGQTRVAGQYKVGETILDPLADPSLDRPISIRTRRVIPPDRG
jgi:hypothetical protein